MPTWVPIVVIPVLTTVLTGLVQIFTVRYQVRNELQRLQLAQLQPRIDALKVSAGDINTYLSGWGVKQHLDLIHSRYRQLDEMRGAFAEYSQVADAVREFIHQAGVMIDDFDSSRRISNTSAEREDMVKKLGSDYDALMSACNDLLKGQQAGGFIFPKRHK